MRVRVPCSTANLGPGIDCLGVALNRYLTVEAELDDRTSFRFGSGFLSPVADADNLFLAAAVCVFRQAGARFPGVKAQMSTQIPTSRGLASSASAIVAGAFWANEVLNAPLSTQAIIALSASLEGHPDNVVPCAVGGFTAAMTEGERVAYVKLPFSDSVSFVAVIPDFPLSTHEARKILPQSVALDTAVHQIQRACTLTAAIAGGNWETLAHALKDEIFTPARKTMIPGFDDVSCAATAAGAWGVMISGAGPTVMALTAENADAVGNAMRDAFLQHGVHAEAAVLSVDHAGVICEQGNGL